MSQIWYISPSNQSGNIGISGYGSEQSQMYLLTDAITPHLDRCGISFHVADPEETLAQRCGNSNAMGAAFHLALHSNAGGNGGARGPIAFYHTSGKALAEALLQELKALGQKSNRSSSLQRDTALYELRTTTAAACLLEVDFHDSATGVEFLTTRRAEIGEAIAKAIVSMDGKPWVPPVQNTQFQNTAAELGLLSPDGNGDYRWQEPMTRSEAAEALIRLKELLE